MDTSERLSDYSAHPNDGNMISHAVDIMKAAFPFLDSDSQKSISLIIKTDELFQTFRQVKENNTVMSLSVRKQSIDIEALLKGVREVCYPHERKIIDMILNFMQAKRMFDMYAQLSEVMASQSDTGETTGETMGQSMNETMGNLFGANTNSNMSEMLESLLTPEQKSTFDNMSMILNMMQQ